jgi:peptidyl-prolyl cis-trans isomerase B (cyclophilin B)
MRTRFGEKAQSRCEEDTTVAGKDRKKELARLRFERQQERRAARMARRRRMKALTGIVVVVAVVGGGGTALAFGLNPIADTPAPKAAAEKKPKPPPRVSVKPGECAYQPYDTSKVPEEMLGQIRQTTKDVGKPSKTPDREGDYVQTISTSQGDIVIEMDAKAAPCTVNSFAYLAGKNFFDGSQCHRLVTSGIHVLQCGDPSGTGMGGPSYRFLNENLPKADGKNTAKPVTYEKGVVAMANSGGAESNGSQFFMLYKDSKLPPQYTRFGTVVEGMDILEEVADAGATADDPQAGGGPPKKKVVIKDITISKK